MKFKFLTLLGLISLGAMAQISTRTGGAANVLANVPNTNTNVGIGTTNPTAKLEVVGNIKAQQGVFSNSYPDGYTFSSGPDTNDKCVALAAGKIIGTGPGYVNTRMLNFFDFPANNSGKKSTAWFGIEDRADVGRFRMIAETGGSESLIMLNKTQQDVFKVYEDGNDNTWLTLPKANSYIGIGTGAPTVNLDVVGNTKISGKVGIGGITTFPSTIGGGNVATYNLFVKGGIATDEVRVALNSSWADYVFEKYFEGKSALKADYTMPTLEEIEAYTKANKHLPSIPSAKEMQTNGVELGDMTNKLLQKIEELTLYVIEQNKRIKSLEETLNNK